MEDEKWNEDECCDVLSILRWQHQILSDPSAGSTVEMQRTAVT